jgi:hypothetical protein
MTIQITQPEVEALINQRLQGGRFRNAEDVILHALQSSSATGVPAAPASRRPAGRKSLAQLFADSPFKGLDIDFERDPDYGRDVAL